MLLADPETIRQPDQARRDQTLPLVRRNMRVRTCLSYTRGSPYTHSYRLEGTHSTAVRATAHETEKKQERRKDAAAPSG
jgi:hypothetical protein